MNNYGGEGNYYTIRHVVLATGLSDRTRGYTKEIIGLVNRYYNQRV